MKVIYEGEKHLVVDASDDYGFGIVSCERPSETKWVGKHQVEEYVPEKHDIETNTILKNVRDLLEQQTKKGIKKYGTTVQTSDYSLAGWLDHIQMELLDALVYTETLKAKVKDVEKILG